MLRRSLRVERHAGGDGVLQALCQRDVHGVAQIITELFGSVDAHDHHDVRVGIAHGDAAADPGVVQKGQLGLQRGIDRLTLREDRGGVRAILQLEQVVMDHILTLCFMML